MKLATEESYLRASDARERVERRAMLTFVVGGETYGFAIEHVRDFREPCTVKSEPSVAPIASGGFRGWIAIDRDQSPFRSQHPEDALAVAAPPEGCVDVGAVTLDRQRSHRFLEQDRDVAGIGHQS